MKLVQLFMIWVGLCIGNFSLAVWMDRLNYEEIIPVMGHYFIALLCVYWIQKLTTTEV